MKYWVLGALLCVGGCASQPVVYHEPDSTYVTAMETGRSAFDLGHPEEAERLFQRGFQRALLRDDASALHDAGFNVATAQLAQHHASAALKTLDEVSAALRLRGVETPGDLVLVRSAVLLRLGRAAEGLAAGQKAQALVLSVEDRDRAQYLVGRAAFALKNQTVLAGAAQALCSTKKNAATQPDCVEMQVRQALLQGQGERIVAQAVTLAGQRRDVHDYDNMREALALAAAAADQAGNKPQAAALRARLNASKAAADVFE